jgi:hypothetical protein
VFPLCLRKTSGTPSSLAAELDDWEDDRVSRCAHPLDADVHVSNPKLKDDGRTSERGRRIGVPGAGLLGQ